METKTEKQLSVTLNVLADPKNVTISLTSFGSSKLEIFSKHYKRISKCFRYDTTIERPVFSWILEKFHSDTIKMFNFWLYLTYSLLKYIITLYICKYLEERIDSTSIFLISKYSYSNFLRFYKVISDIIGEIIKIEASIICFFQYLNCLLRSYIRLHCFAQFYVWMIDHLFQKFIWNLCIFFY